MTLQLIVFIVLALFIAICSVLAVTTSRILRAATYLLFVLFGTAGIYFQLNYSFLGAVQLLIYAGGITVLYVFSILLTSSQGDKAERLKNGKIYGIIRYRQIGIYRGVYGLVKYIRTDNDCSHYDTQYYFCN